MKIAASSFILHPSSFPRYLPHHSREQKSRQRVDGRWRLLMHRSPERLVLHPENPVPRYPSLRVIDLYSIHRMDDTPPNSTTTYTPPIYTHNTSATERPYPPASPRASSSISAISPCARATSAAAAGRTAQSSAAQRARTAARPGSAPPQRRQWRRFRGPP
jgi:hypothetical protein